MASSPGRPSIRRRLGPFRHNPFAVYWAGGVLSNSGTWLQAVAASVFVYQLTNSAFMVGVLNFANFLPILLFSLPAGILSDRLDRRLLVIYTHAAASAVAVVLAYLALTSQANELYVIGAAFAMNTAYAFAKPALVALLPSLVPRDELADAVSLNTLQFMGGQLLGPLVAAITIATSGPGLAFAINAATYFGPVLSMAYLRRRRVGARRERDARGDGAATTSTSSVGGLAYVRGEYWIIFLLFGVVATSAALEFLRTLAPVYVVERLAAPESTAGLIIAALSVGSATGLFAYVRVRKLISPPRLASTGLLLQAGGLLGSAAAGSMAPALASAAVIGLGFAFTFTVLTGTLQGEVPDSMRGRVMSYHTISHLGNRPFAALAAGGLASALGPQAVLLVGLLMAPLGIAAVQRAWVRLSTRSVPDDADMTASALADSPPSRG